MIPYKTKSGKLHGTNFKEVNKHAHLVYKIIRKATKRKPYIRSAYFNKQKVFFDYFWIHLQQKHEPERFRRLKYFEAGIELVKSSRNHPESMQNPNKKSEMLHRFTGITRDGEIFYVQIKDQKKSNKKELLSIFPKK